MRPKMNSAFLEFTALDIDDPQRGRIELDSSTRGLIMAMNELSKAIELLTKVEWVRLPDSRSEYRRCPMCLGDEVMPDEPRNGHMSDCELGRFLKINNCHHSAQSWWYDEAGNKHCSDCEE